MFDNLVPVAIALITFALIIGVGQIVLQNFGNAVGGTANTTVNTLQGYLGTSSGGLVTWTTAIIALVIGVLFIAAIMGLRGRKY